jgi:hypothetical protein
MNWIIAILVALHVLAGVFWISTTNGLAAMPPARWPGFLRRSQAGAAGAAIVFGLILWAMLHQGAPGTGEIILGIGALCAIVALIIQQAVSWPAQVRAAAGSSADESRASGMQRLATLLLSLALVAMVVWRWIG